jgi:hypothetical protein
MASGLIIRTKRSIKTCFRYASATKWFKLAHIINSLAHSSIGTVSSLLNLKDSKYGLYQLVCMRFQDLFHSPNRGSFHLSLTVLVHYRCLCVFSLRRWTCYFHTGFHVPRATLEQPEESFSFRVQDYYLLWCDFPCSFFYENVL